MANFIIATEASVSVFTDDALEGQIHYNRPPPPLSRPIMSHSPTITHMMIW